LKKEGQIVGGEGKKTLKWVKESVRESKNRKATRRNGGK
jgi:hypothetical protein